MPSHTEEEQRRRRAEKDDPFQFEDEIRRNREAAERRRSVKSTLSELREPQETPTPVPISPDNPFQFEDEIRRNREAAELRKSQEIPTPDPTPTGRSFGRRFIDQVTSMPGISEALFGREDVLPKVMKRADEASAFYGGLSIDAFNRLRDKDTYGILGPSDFLKSPLNFENPQDIIERQQARGFWPRLASELITPIEGAAVVAGTPSLLRGAARGAGAIGRRIRPATPTRVAEVTPVAQPSDRAANIEAAQAEFRASQVAEEVPQVASAPTVLEEAVPPVAEVQPAGGPPLLAGVPFLRRLKRSRPSGAAVPMPPRGTPLLSNPVPFTDQMRASLDLNKTRQVFDRLARIPAVGGAFRWANPTLAVETNVGKASIVRASLLDEGRQKVQSAMSFLRQAGDQETLFGVTDPKTGLISKGPFKGRSVNQIAENPSRYQDLLNAEQRQWFSATNRVEDEILEFYRRNGIDIANVPLEDIEAFAGRIHVAIVKDGEVIAQGRVGGGGGRLAAHTGAEHQRVFATMEEAQAAGFAPMPYDASIQVRMQAAWNRVVNQRTQEWLLSNPGEGVTMRPQQFGEVPTFGDRRDLNFPGQVIEGPAAPEFVSAVNRMMTLPEVNGLLSGLNMLNAVPRMFMLAGDESLFAIQLIASAFRHPFIFGQGLLTFNETLVRAILNPHAARQWRASRQVARNQAVQESPGLIMSSGGNEFTEALANGGLLSPKGIYQGNNSLLRLLGRLPSIAATPLRPFQYAFEETLDEAGTNLMKALRHLAGGDPVKLQSVVDYANQMRGLYSSARLGLSPTQRLVESAILLAPRYRRATAALHASVLQGGLRGDLARKAYASLLTGTVLTYTALTIALEKARGKSNEEITNVLKRGLDPRSRQFLLWNIGGQAVGVGSKFVSDSRMLARIFTDPGEIINFKEFEFNPMVRWVRSQLSPTLSSAWDIFSGSNYIGDPRENDFSGYPLAALKSLGVELRENLTPIWVAATAFEGGSVKDRTIRASGEFVGLRTYPWPSPTRDEISQRLYGVDYRDLPTTGTGASNRRKKVRDEWEYGLNERRKEQLEQKREREKEKEERRRRDFGVQPIPYSTDVPPIESGWY